MPREVEDALVVASGNGDMMAAARLIDQLSPRVLTQATRMIGNAAEAEEITQEAMVRLWQASRNWHRTEARVSTWLYRVTANLCIDRLRLRRATLPLDDMPEPVDPQPGAMERLQNHARLEALREALSRLPERQAMAVSLRYMEGLANPEIAEIMGIGVDAVESLTARGKRGLAAALSGRREELGYADE